MPVVDPDTGALVLTWDAIDGLFPTGLLGGMFSAWCAGLQALATDAALWNSPLGVWLDETEKARRARRNATDHPLSEQLLHEPFLRQALAAPDRIAVLAAGHAVTYGELLAQAMGIAQALAGTEPDRLVAVAIPKGWLQIAAVLGVLLAGGAYAPIDPALPEARRRHLIVVSEATCVLTLGTLDLAWADNVRVIAVDQLAPAPAPTAMPARRAGPADLAYVIFTSGSTGEPKGVMIEHRAAVNTVRDVNERFQVGPADRVLAVSELSFDLSVYDIFGLLGAGGAIVVPDGRSAKDPDRLAKLVLDHRVTIWNSVPMFVQLFLISPAAAQAIGALRLVMMSGDWIPLDLPGRLHEANRAVEVVSLGGATEAAIWSILYPVGPLDPSWPSVPYGVPMRNQRFHVLDARMAEAPDWVAGELYIAGAGLARGYWRDAPSTEARFVMHPATGERLYRTGDLGRYRDDGVIEFLGRDDGQVKVGGHRVELGEIEAVLARHPAVAQAAVVSGRDAAGRTVLAAFYVATESGAPDTPTLSAFLAESLPAYMLPATIKRLDAMPLNANGKLNRKALRDPAPADRSPTTPRVALTVPAPPAVHDSDVIETCILAIWRDVLVNPLLPPEGKLFENGAHSFHAVEANLRINRALGLGCTVTDIFEFATVRALAAALAARKSGGTAALVEPVPEPTPAAVFAVQRDQRRRLFRAMTSA